MTVSEGFSCRIFGAGGDILVMMALNDQQLLAQYTREGSEEAFAALVHRHLDLVYSAALRQVRSPELAEEVAQSVFIDLSRNAARLKSETVLTAWLYQVARRTAVDVVRRFRRLRALVIGDAILDSYLEGTAARLCSEGPVPVVQKTSEQHAPGGAANTAANLRALGAHVAFLGVVGRDAPGALLRSAFREQGIDERWLVEDEHGATPHKVRILADGQYVVRFDEEIRSVRFELRAEFV